MAETQTETRARPGTTADTSPSTAGIALDLLLAEAGASPRERFLPGRSAAKLVGALARRPRTVARQTVGLGRDVVRVAAGRSDRQVPRGDRRFMDPAWGSNWALRRVLQAYLTVGERIDGLIAEAELGWDDDRKLRFATQNLVDALAPTNFALTNPEVLKTTIDTGGANFVSGARHLVRDIREPPRLPRNVDTRRFKVGENLALSAGAVVVRDERFELIQYRPASPEVRETPLLIVPPMINRFYITDLAPGKSLVEYLLERGQQVFAISWRNPGKEHSDWGLDHYAAAVLEGLDAVRDVSGSERVHVYGNCAGGQVASTVAAHLAEVDELERVASLTLGVCVIDNARSNVVNAMVNQRSVQMAKLASARKGYLDGADLASVFLWLRPNDLIWPYVVNNWLLGKEPPAFDILYWNADTTRLPAALHRDFLEMASENRLREPGGVVVLGTPIDLGKITTDSYLVAGLADHITPWQNCYRTTQLLGGSTRFVLSTSGHIAAIVNPPTNKKATFRTADERTPPDAEAWLAESTVSTGTWWSDWDAWLAERGEGMKATPRRLGSRRHPVLDEAPGAYVHES
jgi:poly[(R)-3-hydroxyalkanoate] polymerase subunit PhaC